MQPIIGKNFEVPAAITVQRENIMHIIRATAVCFYPNRDSLIVDKIHILTPNPLVQLTDEENRRLFQAIFESAKYLGNPIP